VLSLIVLQLLLAFLYILLFTEYSFVLIVGVKKIKNKIAENDLQT